MYIHELPTIKTKKDQRVGRGGKRGKTSGRGTKGQKARAGHKMRPEMRDTIKRIPKRRGFGKNRARTVNASVQKPVSVNLDTLERLFEQGTTITPQSLHKRGALTISKNRMPPVKILGRGVVTKKFIVKNCLVSLSAKEAIEKAGGKVS